MTEALTARRLCSIVTRWSRLRAADDRANPGWEASWEYLARRYRPAMQRYVYQQLRRRGRGPDDYETAEDIVAEWFARAIERGGALTQGGERVRSFRAYVQTQLKRFTDSWMRERKALKRGGGLSCLPIETAGGLAATDAEATCALDRGILEVALTRAIEALRTRSERYAAVIDDLLREQAAGRTSPGLPRLLGMVPGQLPVVKHRALTRLRLFLAAELRELVSDEEDFEGLWALLEPYMP